MSKVIATVQPHYGQAQHYPVERITKLWIVVRFNNAPKGIGRFDRARGYSAGAFRDRMSLTPSCITNLDELNAIADANGGTWKPTARASASGAKGEEAE